MLQPISFRWALASLSLSMLLSSLGTSIANVGLPTLAEAFGASFQAVQWIVLAYLLATTTLIVSVGRLGDVAGHRRLLLAGIVLFTLASFLCSAASTLSWLIAARAAQGLGAAILMALSLALVGGTVPKTKTGSAMGLLGTMSAVGTALGPSLGGVLISGLGWRAIFFVKVPLGVLAFLLAWRYLPADRPSPQVKLASPSIHLAMFRHRALSAGLAISLLVASVIMATLVVGPFYLSRSLLLDPALVGIVMSAGPLVAALTGLPAGRSVDRFGARRMTLLGLGALAAGCSALALLPSSLGIGGYLAPLVVITAGYALFQAANHTAVLTDIGPDQRGVVSGLLNLSRNLGLIAGTSLLGGLFANAAAFGAATADVATAPPDAVAAGMRITFAATAMLIAAALALAAATAKRAALSS